MADAIGELTKLYDMLGTVATKQYAEQIQKVCNEFYYDGERHAKMHIPDNLKTAEDYENYLKAVMDAYKNKVFGDGVAKGVASQAKRTELAFKDRLLMRGDRISRFDIFAVLAFLNGRARYDR